MVQFQTGHFTKESSILWHFAPPPPMNRMDAVAYKGMIPTPAWVVTMLRWRIERRRAAPIIEEARK